MTAGKKMTVKSLAEEFQKLKQEVEELWSLKHKVAKLEKTIKKVHFLDENIPKSYLKCKKIETPVESGKELKKYIKDKHPDKSKQVLLDWGWLF